MSYETLEMFLNGKEQSFFWMQLEKLPSEKRIDELCEMLLKCIAGHIDERAAFLWEALMHAVSDFLLAPIMSKVKEFGRQEIRIRNACEADPEATAAHQANAQRRVALAQEIYGLIPAFKNGSGWDSDLRENRKIKEPTLLHTKKLIWNEITTYWHDVADQQTALGTFDWLLVLDLSFKEEQDALTEVIRQQSDGMKPERLLACMLMIKCYRDNHYRLQKNGQDVFMRCHDPESWLDKLLHAWIRCQKRFDIVAQLEALAPVTAYREAWGILSRYSEPIGAFCRQIDELRDFVNPPGGFSSIFDCCPVIVRYEKLGEGIVEFNVPPAPCNADQATTNSHYIVEADDKIGGWLKGRTGITVVGRIGRKTDFSGFHAHMEFQIRPKSD